MWLDNLKIFFKLKWIYAYLAFGFLTLPLIRTTQYDNLISIIGALGCFVLFNIERVLEKIK